MTTKQLCSALVISLLFAGAAVPSIAQEKAKKEVKAKAAVEPAKKAVEKAKPAAEAAKKAPADAKASADDVIGKTADGKTVYGGPKGGLYYTSDKGAKVYVKEKDVVGAKVVDKTKDGKSIYEGPKGGRFYYNDAGNKTYIKK